MATDNGDRPAYGDIEIRLSKVSQLFNSLDPSPFYSRDLDDDAEEFITGWAAELGRAGRLRIGLHLPPEEAEAASKLDLPRALSQYFADRAMVQERQLRELFRIGWRYLGVGLTVLAVCLLCSQLARSVITLEPAAKLVEESLIIVGWVANWKPIETFLYDWWPILRRIRLYRRLEAAEVQIKVDQATVDTTELGHSS